MEELTTFLSSDSGRILCYVLIFVGVMDIIVAKLFFGKNIKKLELSILPAMPPEQKELIEKKIKGLQSIIRITIFYGVAFIAFAVFGLTR